MLSAVSTGWISNTNPSQTNTPVLILLGSQLMACGLQVKEWYTKHVSASKWQKNSLTTFLTPTDHSIEVLMKDMNHYKGQISSEFFVNVILDVCQCWVDSITTHCSTPISSKTKQVSPLPLLKNLQSVVPLQMWCRRLMDSNSCSCIFLASFRTF